jgi:hypothetical protein
VKDAAIDARRLGAVLLVLGATGVVLAALVAFGLFRGALAARDLDDRIAAGQARIVTNLNQMTTRLDLVATSFDNASATITTTKDALAHASDVLDDVSISTNLLADALNVNIFGNQPFAGLGERFRGLSDRVKVFQDDADTLGKRLNTNATNVSEIADEVRTIRDKVSDLTAEIGSFTHWSEVVNLLIGGAILAGILVAWVAVGAAVLTWIGWRLRRSGRRVPPGIASAGT